MRRSGLIRSHDRARPLLQARASGRLSTKARILDPCVRTARTACCTLHNKARDSVRKMFS